MNESAIYEIRLKDRFSSPLSGLETKMNSFEGKVGGLKNSFSGLGGTIAGAFAGGLVAGGIASLVSGLKSITAEAFNATREFTNLTEAIKFASGKDAGKNIQFLDEMIERLGLDMRSTFKGFKTWQGALMGTSLEGEKGRDIFESVSKAATVMKLSGEQTEGAFLALGQMMSKGTVSAEELRGQLGERLPGAFQMAARAMGVTTAKLGEMMKQGEVVAEDFLPKFAAELNRTFNPGVLSAQQSFNANWNRFNNFILKAKIAFGNGLLPAINEFITAIPKLDFSAISFTFSQVTDQFKELISILGLSVDSFTTLSVAVRYIGYLFRVAFMPIRFGIEMLKEFILAIKAAIPLLTDLKEIMAGVFTFDFKRAEDGLKSFNKNFIEGFRTVAESAAKFMKDEATGWAKIFQPINDPTKKGSGYADGMGDSSGAGGKSPSVSGKESTAGVEKISSGTRNITVNINKLVETITFQKADGMSEGRLQDMIKRALITAVNDVNIVAQ